jgi:hypothetical protein
VYDGFGTMIVTARNPRADPVVVTLPGTTLGEADTSFEYRVDSPIGALGGGVRARDEGVTRFAPGETKRHVFDFRVVRPDGSGDLPTGTHRFHGAYGGHWSADVMTVVIP